MLVHTPAVALDICDTQVLTVHVHVHVHVCMTKMTYEHTKNTIGGFPTSARAVLNFLLLPPLKREILKQVQCTETQLLCEMMYVVLSDAKASVIGQD